MQQKRFKGEGKKAKESLLPTPVNTGDYHFGVWDLTRRVSKPTQDPSPNSLFKHPGGAPRPHHARSKEKTRLLKP